MLSIFVELESLKDLNISGALKRIFQFGASAVILTCKHPSKILRLGICIVAYPKIIILLYSYQLLVIIQSLLNLISLCKLHWKLKSYFFVRHIVVVPTIDLI